MYLFCERGDTVTYTFQIYDGDSPRDLSADLVRFTVKRDIDDQDGVALLLYKSSTTGITILPQTGTTLGQFTVTITPGETVNYKAGFAGVWDVQITLDDGSVVTPIQGDIVFPGDVTRGTG